MSKEVMKLALEALEKIHRDPKGWWNCLAEITALREALAEQPAQQEQNRQIDQLIQERDHRDEIIDKLCDAVLGPDRYEWSSQYFFEDAVREVEERMAEQPAQTATYTCGVCGVSMQMEQPAQQEPYGYVSTHTNGLMHFNKTFQGVYRDTATEIVAVYTSPPAQRTWVGLTDEEWQDLSDRYGLIIWGPFKREIEAKLKEKNHG